MSNANNGDDFRDLVEVTMELEEETGIIVPDEIAEKFRTVRDVVEYFKNHQDE
jgi:acyl carrier protein